MKRALHFTLLMAVLVGSPLIWADEAAPTKPQGKPALVVMDIQNAYLPYMDEQGQDRALRMVNYAIAMFRERGLPIIVVYHTDPERGPAPGTEPFEFPPEIELKADDIKVTKNFPSAFKKTELEKILHQQGCDTVFLVGLSAVGCVLHTYFDSARLDFRTFMIEGALLSHDTELTKSVERLTDAVDFGSLEYMLLNAPR